MKIYKLVLFILKMKFIEGEEVLTIIDGIKYTFSWDYFLNELPLILKKKKLLNAIYRFLIILCTVTLAISLFLDLSSGVVPFFDSPNMNISNILNISCIVLIIVNVGLLSWKDVKSLRKSKTSPIKLEDHIDFQTLQTLYFIYNSTSGYENRELIENMIESRYNRSGKHLWKNFKPERVVSEQKEELIRIFLKHSIIDAIEKHMPLITISTLLNAMYKYYSGLSI